MYKTLQIIGTVTFASFSLQLVGWLTPEADPKIDGMTMIGAPIKKWPKPKRGTMELVQGLCKWRGGPASRWFS